MMAADGSMPIAKDTVYMASTAVLNVFGLADHFTNLVSVRGPLRSSLPKRFSLPPQKCLMTFLVMDHFLWNFYQNQHFSTQFSSEIPIFFFFASVLLLYNLF